MRNQKKVFVVVFFLFSSLACRASDDLVMKITHATPTYSTTLRARFVGSLTPTITQIMTETSLPTLTQTQALTSTLTPEPNITFTLEPTLTFTTMATATQKMIPATKTPSELQSTAAPVNNAGGCNGSDSSVESTVLSLINSRRQAAGAGSVSLSSNLSDIARSYSRNMAENDFFSHGNLVGRVNPNSTYQAVGETLYAGRDGDNSPSAAVTAWLNSPQHRDKMLNPLYTLAGVGYWCDPSSTYGGYYTVDFANPF